MALLTAATWTLAGVVILAGLGKVFRPDGTDAALRTLHLPVRRGLARVLGVAEVVIGTAVLAVAGTWPAAALALAYAVFAVVAERQRRAGSDCGCFGAAETPVTTLHVGFDAAAAIIVLAATVVRAVPPVPAVITTETVTGALTVVFVGIATALVRLLLTTAPRLAAAVALASGEESA